MFRRTGANENAKENTLMSNTETRTFQVKVRRDGKWWYFEIPEVNMSGQARKLAEVETEAADIIATWLQIDADTVGVTLDVDVPAEISNAWDEAKRREAIARQENAAAARLAREAVKGLRDQGLSQADAGRLLGVTVQRVSQLEGGRRTLRKAS